MEIFDVQEKIPSKISSIDFETALKKAAVHSYDLKMADFETLIAKTGVTSAKSEYFPKLVVMAGEEYAKSFADYATNSVATVGDAFINPYTRYQSVLGITLSYNVFDFGLRRHKLDIAKEDVNLKKLKEQEAKQELELNILDVYTKILISKRQIDNAYEVFKLENKKLALLERLFKAKEISATELNIQKINVLSVKKRVAEMEQVYFENIKWLEFYTGEQYEADTLIISDIKDTGYDFKIEADCTKSLIWKIYNLELKKKELELKAVKKNNYPKAAVYGKYYLYGSNYNSFRDGISDVEPSSLSFGGNIYMPIFDGLQNQANIKRVNLEYQKMQIEKEKAMLQWTTRINALKSNYFYLNEQMKENENILAELNKKGDINKRLLSKRLIGPIDLLNVEIEILEEKSEFLKNKITAASVSKGIEILLYGTILNQNNQEDM